MTLKDLLSKQKYYSPILLLWVDENGQFHSKYYEERERHMVIAQYGNKEIDYFNFQTDYEQLRAKVFPPFMKKIITKVFFKINPQVLRIELQTFEK